MTCTLTIGGQPLTLPEIGSHMTTSKAPPASLVGNTSFNFLPEIPQPETCRSLPNLPKRIEKICLYGKPMESPRHTSRTTGRDLSMRRVSKKISDTSADLWIQYCQQRKEGMNKPRVMCSQLNTSQNNTMNTLNSSQQFRQYRSFGPSIMVPSDSRYAMELDPREKQRQTRLIQNSHLQHRAPVCLLMGGRQMEMNEREDYASEINKLKNVFLPTVAKDLYVGKGFKLPSNHALNHPKLKKSSIASQRALAGLPPKDTVVKTTELKSSSGTTQPEAKTEDKPKPTK